MDMVQPVEGHFRPRERAQVVHEVGRAIHATRALGQDRGEVQPIAQPRNAGEQP
jgi:hypothetical protein